MSLIARPGKSIVYPETDGAPMAENTLQFDWIVRIKEGLDDLFRDNPLVFVAGDLFWYPVEGDPSIVVAPDTLVAFGRPKGHRRSYLQWQEGGIAPQVVFEVLSPGNKTREMIRKFQFYELHGAEEYYLYDPDNVTFDAWLRRGGVLQDVPDPNGWTSPRLGVRFDLSGPELVIYRPDGRPLLNYEELSRERQAVERQRVEAERQRVEAERQRDCIAADRDALAIENARLAAKLREAGLDPPADGSDPGMTA